MEKKITKFGDTEIEKQTFYQHKIPISIKNTDIYKTVVSNKVSFDKNILNISLATKKLDIYVYFFQK